MMNKVARIVPKGTFSAPAPATVKVSLPKRGEADYDWRNPFHNPEGIRPRKPRVLRVTEKQVARYVAKLRKMAEDCHEIGPSDLIHELDVSDEMRTAVLDALLA